MKKSQIENLARNAKKASRVIATLSSVRKNKILKSIAWTLNTQIELIQNANKRDIKKALENNISPAMIDRLTLTDARFRTMCSGVLKIATLDDPIGIERESRILSNGALLKKITSPLGVVGIIYESRPNVTIDVAALCLKSGNAVVLKGGRDAFFTNEAMVRVITSVLKKEGVPTAAVTFLKTFQRADIYTLLTCDKFIDVIIPRGGYGLIKAVVEHSTIPVLYHAEGGSRIYIDESATLKDAISISVNAKVNRPATCNSLDVLVVHQAIAKKFLPRVAKAMALHNVEIFADDTACKIIPAKKATQIHWNKEFLSYAFAIKIVDDVSEAIEFINKYTKRHTEGIVSSNRQVIRQFVNSIDAAAITINCSTRLHDGGVFGLGAEVGIATGKLHARGPVGLNELVTYRWILEGDGQIRE